MYNMLRSTLKDESISKSGLVIIGSASKYSAKYIYIFIIFSFINKASGGNAQLLNSYETWDANPRIIPSTDPAGIGYNSTNGRFYIVDSEINEPGGEWNNVNVFETNAVGGTLYNSYLTVGSSIEPTGICWSPSNNSYYVVNDNTNRLYRYQIISGNFVKQDDWALGASPFSIDDAEGLTINPGNGHIYIVDGASGDKKVVAVQIISGNLVHISQESFSVSGTVDDPEGIAYRPYDGHLYIVSSPDEGIFEYDVNGNKLDFYNISGFTPTPINPQGLTFGPRSSNPNFDALYIADGGIDNGRSGMTLSRMV